MRAVTSLALGLLLSATPAWGQPGCGYSTVGGPPVPAALLQWVWTLSDYDAGSGAELYAGGFFGTLGSTLAANIARWNGTSWAPAGGGVNDTVRALAVFDDGSGPALYVGGSFTTADGLAIPATGIARWNGVAWSPVGGGLNGAVYALHVHDDGSGPALYAGGYFTTEVGGALASRIARWDGITWTQIGAGLNDAVHALATFDDGTGPALYAGGFFTATATGAPLSYIGRWDGSSWTSVGGGVNSSVWAMTTFDDGTGPSLFVGGNFTSTLSGVAADYVARWDGSSWYRLGLPVAAGGGLNQPLRCMEVYDEGFGPVLVVGGYFYITNTGAPAAYIARWDGFTWSEVGGGLDGKVRALRTFDDGSGPALFLGGSFENALAGVSMKKIGKWSCGSGISLTATQPGGSGGPIHFNNANLTAGNEYFNIFSLDTCGGGVGTGSYAGLCITTQPNLLFMISQLQMPLGTPLFHFDAASAYVSWGPYAIPPLTVEGLCFDYTGGVIGDVSPVVQIAIQ